MVRIKENQLKIYKLSGIYRNDFDRRRSHKGRGILVFKLYLECSNAFPGVIPVG